MFENYSYKIKLKALFIVFCMLSFAAYKRSFSSLISAVKENSDLKNKVASIDSKSKGLYVLNNELAIIDQILGKQNIHKEKIQQNIVSFVAVEAKKVSIYELNSVHEFTDDNHKIYTHRLDVTGGINELLQLSYDFEKKFILSKVVNIEFYTTKKNNLNETLHLKITFQNYENNK